MRYIVMIAIAEFAALITGGVSPQIPILGAEPDILLAAMLAMELREKTATPVVVFSISAVFLDAFYAPAIGFYSLPYATVGTAVYMAVRKVKINPVYGPAAVCAAAWMVKDLISALLSFLFGNSFDFFHIFLNSTLPGTLVNGVLIIPLYLVMGPLYKNSFMVPSSVGLRDEFPGLVRKKKR